MHNKSLLVELFSDFPIYIFSWYGHLFDIEDGFFKIQTVQS